MAPENAGQREARDMSIASEPGAGTLTAPVNTAARTGAAPRYLFGPVVDFLGLGGASLVLLPLMMLLPEKELMPSFKVAMLLLAYVINHPHFAFSYQIFYEGFRAKAFAAGGDAVMRARYIFAGLVAPAALASFLAICLATGDVQTLAYAANLMVFLVGWHYVKQGYGMLMVDAALKRCFFDPSEKRVLLVNAYAVWALAYLMVNDARSSGGLWGISYAMFDIPPLLLAVATCVAVGTSVATVSVLLARARSGVGVPMAGTVAYLVTLYVWMLARDVTGLWLILVPALHSLQYLFVVARYRINRCRDTAAASQSGGSAGPSTLRCMVTFAGFGVLLGYLGFWGVPIFLNAALPYDQEIFGASALLFVFWIFINVHHYCLDNVMWRRENPDVRKHLFG
jgi:hypothetical protein